MAKKKKDNFYEKWEDWEKQAQKRNAWGEYINTMNRIQNIRDDKKLLYGTDQEKEEIKNKRKNSSPIIYIG